MIDLLTVFQMLGRPTLRRHARQYLRSVREQDRPPRRRGATEVLFCGVGLNLGTEESGQPVTISPQSVRTHGLILGASGAGKSCAAATVMEQIGTADGGVGLIDAKGELFAWMQTALSGRQESETAKVLCLDFAGANPVPYGLLKPRSGESAERLIDRRMEAFDDLLGRDGHLSLRMSRMLRNLLLVMVEHDLPFPIVEFLFAHTDVLTHLAGQSPDGRIRDYFAEEFPRERQTTLVALAARLDSILRHQSLRLSFGSDTFVDFRDAMDGGAIILINVGGPTLPRSHTRLIQSLIVSDIRQAVFVRRERQRPFTWFLDEAQCLFSQTGDTENVSTLLAMARSFGTNLVLITQSLIAASPSQDFLTSVDTNFRWLLLFRCGLRDAAIVEPALPASGRVVRQRYGRGQIAYLTPQQEIAERVRAVTDLPPRHAYFWLRGVDSPAVPLTIRSVRFHVANRDQHVDSSESPSASAIRLALEARERQLRHLVDRPRQTARGTKRTVDDVLAALERDLAEVDQR